MEICGDCSLIEKHVHGSEASQRKKTIYELLETALREEGEMLILSYLDILSYPKK